MAVFVRDTDLVIIITEMEEKNKGEPSFIDKDARLVFPLGKFGLTATSLWEKHAASPKNTDSFKFQAHTRGSETPTFTTTTKI